jgi:hypothetical protein
MSRPFPSRRGRTKPTPSLFMDSDGRPAWALAFREAGGLAARFGERPTVCWTVSAGHDMRPLVFFSEPMRRELAEVTGLPPQELPRPDLFLHTSLAMDLGKDGLHDLRVGQVVHEDRGTRITVVGCEPLHLDRERIHYAVDSSRVRYSSDPLARHEYDAALLQLRLTCLQTGYEEIAQVLYLAMENLNAFDAYLSHGGLDVRYLVATREGLAMGGCGRSILDYLYGERRILGAREEGFEPQYVVTWSGGTDERFRTSARTLYPGLRRIAPYIKERGLQIEHQIYRLWR